MSDQEFNWGEVTGQAVRRLTAKKVAPCPPEIVALAQRSWDGVPDPDNEGEKLHAMTWDFNGNTAKAKAFAELLRVAGAHTTPPTSVKVVIDPHNDGTKPKDEAVVGWLAGQRRGKAVS